MKDMYGNKIITEEKYNRDYFERGLETGKSLYTDYKWIPERSLQEAVAIIDGCKLTRGSLVLDYGCAKGFLVKALRLLGRDAYGCDISRYAICNAHPDTRSYLRLSTHGFPFETDYVFELCIAKDVFEHMHDVHIEDALKDIKKNCKELLVIVPLGDGEDFYIPEYNYDSTHVTAQTLTWWSGLFERNGLQIKSCSTRFEGIKENWQHYPTGNGFFQLVCRG